MPPPIGVIVELPQMHNLVDRAGIGLEEPNQFPVMLSFLKGRKADLLIELDRFGHCADPERIGSQFIEGHCALPFRERISSRRLRFPSYAKMEELGEFERVAEGFRNNRSRTLCARRTGPPKAYPLRLLFVAAVGSRQ